jgi:hypothetical protein
VVQAAAILGVLPSELRPDLYRATNDAKAA